MTHLIKTPEASYEIPEADIETPEVGTESWDKNFVMCLNAWHLANGIKVGNKLRVATDAMWVAKGAIEGVPDPKDTGLVGNLKADPLTRARLYLAWLAESISVAPCEEGTYQKFLADKKEHPVRGWDDELCATRNAAELINATLDSYIKNGPTSGTIAFIVRYHTSGGGIHRLYNKESDWTAIVKPENLYDLGPTSDVESRADVGSKADLESKPESESKGELESKSKLESEPSDK